MRCIEIPGALQVENDDNGLTRVLIATPQTEAEIFLHGAHITRWIPAGRRPVLFTSSRSMYAPGKPIRGGVPLVFPWFGPRGGGLPGPMHGYARISEWTLHATNMSAKGAVELVFTLPQVDALRLAFRVSIGAQLEMELDVRNTSAEELSFEEAFHTYFAVGDIRQVSISGLEGTEYIDKADAFQRKRRPAEPIRIDRYIDQVYVNTTAACVIDDPAWARRIVIDKGGSATTVVWNPWADKTPGMPDMAPEDWREMVCVETANAGENAIRLAPGATHIMRAAIHVE
jgi:glucose-6-phosphate 1-epimerase